jgi:hypothetical protein
MYGNTGKLEILRETSELGSVKSEEDEISRMLGIPEIINPKTSNNSQKYYINVVNLWNNNQQNSQPASDQSTLGLTFVENPNIKTLLSFEGDHIIQGRQGAALRFGSTTKLFSNLNEWSEIGNDDNPITILSNGFSYEPGEKFHVEKINKDLSTIYLTSAQILPLQTDRTGNINPLTNPIDPSKYSNAQIIINSDRITLNSKKDEVMIFAKTNVEISTKNIINLNANERIHLNGGTVFLGTVNNQLPSEPLILGNKWKKWMEDLIDAIGALTDISPVGPCAPTKSDPQWGKIASLKAQIPSLLSDISFTKKS